MKITKIKNGNYEFWYSTGRQVPTKKDPGKLKYEVLHRTSFATKKDAERSYIDLKNKYEQGGNDTNQTFNTFVSDGCQCLKEVTLKAKVI